MERVLRLLPALLVAGCLAENPAYDPGSASGAASSGAGSTSVGKSTSGSGEGTTAASAEGSGSPSGTVSTSGQGDTSSDDQGPGSSTTTSGFDVTSTTAMEGSSSSSGGLEEMLAQPCKTHEECAEILPSAECCEANQCADTCAVPCQSVEDCPFDFMGCEHDYCLFPCKTDDDCTDWPGYTCQHGDPLLCEND